MVKGDSVVSDDSLSAVLSDFARTMLTDFPIQGILDHLVGRIVDVLPVTGAGVSLIEAGTAPRYIAASNADALRFERLQSELGEGPCLTAFFTGEPAFVPDLSVDTEYPKFGPAALAAGMEAVFTFPLRHDAGRLGALDLYRDVPGPLDLWATSAAQTLADVAAAYILNAQAREQSAQVVDWFRERSLHDALTGLPNRILLQERLDHASERARRTHRAAAVLFVDLDHFKRVNDAFGHDVGDELLIAVADRLAGVVRPGDTLARVSGDEFVFLCEDLSAAADVDSLVARISAAFATSFELSTTRLGVSASVGIAYSGPGEAVNDSLVIDADLAMYQAKRRGGATHQVIDLRTAREAHDRNDLAHHLREGLAETDIGLTYEPIGRLSDGELVGVEAQVRWTHPVRGVLSPAVTIAAAEQGGQITRLGEWVLEQACRDWIRWSAEHPERALDLSVSISSRQLATPGFVGAVERILASTQMAPGSLVLQMTENFLVEERDRALRTLTALKVLGVGLALEKFGTGLASLVYLRHFPLDIIKLDPSLVRDVSSDAVVQAIVAYVAQFSHILGMSVTAEGVETAQERDGLMAAGCDFAQGHLVGLHMPAGDVPDHLA